MPRRLCLSLGEFFAEVSLSDTDSTCRSARWPLSKSSLEKGLTSFFAESDTTGIDEIQVNLPILESLLRRRLGAPPAFLTTEGFENWLEMNLPVTPQHLSLKPKRVRSPLDNDLVFGISERINTEGEVIKALDVTEIDFLVEKLKMNEVTTVAIGLLHANKNATHENKIAEILKSHNFEVFTSHSYAADAERPRWWAAILTAYLSPLIKDQLDEIKTAFANLGIEAPLKFWTGSGLKSEWQNFESLDLLFGSARILQDWCKQRSLPGLMFLDVDGFYLQCSKNSELSPQWNSELGPVGVNAPALKRLSVQPTSPLTSSWLGGLDLGEGELGFEPGPISMGRGLVPCFIDSLNLIDDDTKVPGLSEHLQSRTQTRYTESVATLARNFSQDEWLDPKELSDSLCETGLRQILREYVKSYGSNVFMAGGLSKVISKRFSKLSLPAQFKINCTPTLLGEMALERTLSKQVQ